MLSCYTYPVSAAMVPPRLLHFSRSSISTCPERSRRVHHTPSQSHSGTHPSLIPEKIPSLFSNTYGNPFCNSLCFQIRAGMGGWRAALDIQTCKPSNLPTRSIPLSPLSATLTKMPISVDSKRLAGTLSHLDATLTKNQGVGVTCPLAPRTQSYDTKISGTHDVCLVPFRRANAPGTSRGVSLAAPNRATVLELNGIGIRTGNGKTTAGIRSSVLVKGGGFLCLEGDRQT
jgi:hypothetical protein